jgi:membrane-bound lytic murein transglycosylase D
MNISLTFLLLLIAINLVGCNTFVTKPTHGKTVISHKTVSIVSHAESKNQEADHFRIDDGPLDLVLFSTEQQNVRFSTAWSISPKNSEVIKQSERENTDKIHLAKNNINHGTPIALSSISVPLTRHLMKNTAIGDKLAAFTKRTRKIKKHRISKFAKKTHRANPLFAKQKLTEQTLSVSQIIANILAEETPETNPFRRKLKHSFQKNDLWNRVRSGYALQVKSNSRIQRSIEKFVKFPSYFKRISRFASPYIYHIVEEIEKRGMPLELTLLPAIESGYKPIAQSHKSAAGLWQFMPATGKYYGLQQNEWYDGRREIISSTTAALDYLQKLYRVFDDDWLLALAAYNYGQGNLRKAIRKNRALKKPTDYWSLSLPKETRQYVPKLLALSEIVAKPQKYGIRLLSIANEPYFEQVNVDRQINLSLAAQLAELSTDEFKRLNSCHKRDVTAPLGPHHIILPIHKARLFKQRIAKIPATMKLTQVRLVLEKSLSGEKLSAKNNIREISTRAKIQKHKVRPGESLWKIAKRYDTTVASIRQWNKLKGKFLTIGQRLIVRAEASRLSILSQK